MEDVKESINLGQGFWILVWDAFGSGLNLINPRLLEVEGRNWWAYHADDEKSAKLATLTAGLKHYHVIDA